ncbi:hypothetical protein [Wolbachia endosymbiont (group A) of Chalcis sispes]|uniref:hypothetical protein n=1 Tax=Wolbachia endosymbiont (group A) of Chalcis sispes TaxID=3066197 RepID=UPI003133180F
MLTEINGTIKLVGEENDQKIQLIIPGSDYEKFKEYKNIDGDNNVINEEFFASFTLNDKRIHITGLYPQEEQTNNSIVTVYASSIASNGTCHFECGDNGTYNSSQLQEIKDQLGLSEDELQVNISKHFIKELKDEINALEAANKKAKNDKTELQTQLDTAQQEKQDLEAEVEKLKAIDSTALQQQLEEKNAKITELEALDAVALQQKLTEKENKITALKAQPDAAVTKLEGEKTTLTNKIKDLEAQLNNQPNAAQLKDKDEKIKDLEAQLSNRPDAAQLKDKEDKIKELEAKINQPNAEVESLKNDLKTKTSQVQQLMQKNKELEAKNKTTEQPKQGNGARYTATVGMGLAAGLIAFTALERTVRLDIWVMVGIAVVSTLAVGSITYAALPSTQVNGAEVQGVSGGKTRQLNTVC